MLRHCLFPTLAIFSWAANPPCAVGAASNPRELEEITVTARRPMQDIGLQKTTFDSISLKESIALSLADVISFNSSLYVKSFGRATLSTVSFRGTSPSHTLVSWNGMPVNSPMLGMTDFSIIPAFFIDKAQLLHGASSLAEAGGGLGGAVSLASAPALREDGTLLSFTQGAGSYSTFDEFLQVARKKGKWYLSTRAVYSSSKNDFTFTNRDKKLNIYDDDHNIIGQYHPKEKNRSGAFKDFHLLQEAACDINRGDRIGLNVWYTASNRELPMLTTDYGEDRGVDNRQRENTLRAVANWRHNRQAWNLNLHAGYIHTRSCYDYRRESAPEVWATLARSRSRVNTFSSGATVNWWGADRWLLTGSLNATHNAVESADHRMSATGVISPIGYEKGRWESSVALTARWQPIDGSGIALMLREESFGKDFSLPIPALLADCRIAQGSLDKTSYRLALRASGSRNYRYPTLNDLYFMPGGNPELESEKGWTYDAGADFEISSPLVSNARLSAAWFDSYISDWILWLPSIKGYFSPRNVKTVHAYGVEIKGDCNLQPHPDWKVDFNGSWAWTPSINCGLPSAKTDKSIGKQLPYIPKFSGSANLRFGWKKWGLIYKFCAYGRRYSQTGNEVTPTSDLPPYSISNITLERSFRLRRFSINAKVSVCNLFNAQYQSVLSRPMPGTNYEAFLEFSWLSAGKEPKQTIN